MGKYADGGICRLYVTVGITSGGAPSPRLELLYILNLINVSSEEVFYSYLRMCKIEPFAVRYSGGKPQRCKTQFKAKR